MQIKSLIYTAVLVLTSLTLSACGGQRVTSTIVTPLEHQTLAVEESQLLDLAVLPFDPGLDKPETADDPAISPAVRNAEAQYLANKLASTIQQTSAWGAVRTVPSRQTVVDVYVEGTIVHSDGETLTLDVSVSDSSNRHWYTKPYSESVGQYAYEKGINVSRDPFQGLFNRIANDLLQYRQQLSAKNVKELRSISSLKFARDFSPEAFGDHIKETPGGQLEIIRLPAENDPILRRIERIRERDYLFVDTMQEHYDAFSRRMDKPYQSWRMATYEEIASVRELKRQSRNRTIGGIVAVIGGIVAAGSNNGAVRSAGAVSIGAGALLVKSGLSKKAELKIHEDVLAELGQSLEAEIEPRVIELEDRTITLTGNVEAQYTQWKALLREIYQAERGEI
ncbi:MAG: hypothetical protein QNK31_11105 [Porticoccus sp.]|nr:hypothetical protein [Porticoccus sp.]